MALEIRVIGKGCYFCQQLTKIAGEVVTQLQIPDATITEVGELDELLDFGVVNPPALVVNGKLKLMGRVLVRSHIQQAIAEEIGSLAQATPASDSAT